jgi:hypothetical protein
MVGTAEAVVAAEARLLADGVADGCVGIDTAAGRGGPPSKKQLKKTVKFGKEERGDKATGKIDMTGWVVPAGCKPVSKKCRGCLKKGHIWVDCLDNVEKVSPSGERRD